MVLDYRAVDLWKDGRKVDSFRISGFLAEHALKASLRVGYSAFSEADLPASVHVKLDGRGWRDIQGYPDDRALAATVARGVQLQLHRSGLRLRDAVVRDKGAEHDMVLEAIDVEPCNTAALGLISGELRMRRIHSETGRKKIREAFQKECAYECVWWQRLAVTNKWSGRLIVLVEFGASGVDFVIRADYIPAGGAARGFFGWPGSRASLAPSVQAPALPAPVPRPTPKPLPRKPAPKPKARARRPWADVRQKLKFRIDSGKRVAPVKDALLEVDKDADVSHLGRDMEGWKKRFPNGEAFKAQRVTCKGGSKEWVATDSFLKGICGCE